MSAAAATAAAMPGALRARALAVASGVTDPELPVLTIADLGVLRDVVVDGDAIEVVITPTYSGCPAMATIALDIELAFEREGLGRPIIRTVLAPAWTTDWLSDEGRRKLQEIGVVPPAGRGRRGLLDPEEDEIACPRCGSHETELLSAFGSTACKALWRCTACAEPFDYFKCI